MTKHCGKPATTFWKLYMRGEVVADEIEDFVTFWETEYDGDLELHDYLGITRNQFSLWARTGKLYPPGIADIIYENIVVQPKLELNESWKPKVQKSRRKKWAPFRRWHRGSV